MNNNTNTIKTSKTSSKLTRNLLVTAGLAAGAVAASAAVVHTSSAAFTATTDNAADSWTAGTLGLTDDDSAAKMFDVGGLVPGQVTTKCINVTYTGTASAVNPIKLYSALNSQTLNTADYLKVKVEQGSGGSFGDCTGFTSNATIINNETLTAMTTNHTNYATGAGTFVPASSPSSVSYRFTVTLDPTTPNSVQGGTANATFTWEIQSA